MHRAATELRTEVAAALPRLRALTDERAVAARGAGKWVRKEILGHLIDSAANNHQRFVRARFTNPFTFPGYEQEAWVAAGGYRQRSWGELVELWAAFNGQVAAVMDTVSADRLSTSCVIGDNPPATLDWVMNDYVRHLRHHLGQIFEGT